MVKIVLALFIVSLNLQLCSAANCTWAKGKFRNAAALPSFIKDSYIECLTESIQDKVTEDFKERHGNGPLGSISYDIFASGGWTPLKIPPGTNIYDRNTPTVTLKIVDGEIRQASPDSARGTASLDGYFHFEWQDDRLRWDSNEWGDMKTIEIKSTFADNIWFPLFNLVPHKSKGSSQASELITPTVTDGGFVKAATFLDWDADCDMDMKNYPYDSARCRARFEGQWVADNSNIKIEITTNTMKKSERFQQSYYWNYKTATINSVTVDRKDYIEIEVEIERVNTSTGVEILCPILIATIIAILAPLFATFKWQSIIKVIALLFMYLSLINFVQIHWVTRYAASIPKLLEYHRFTMVVTVIGLILSLFLWSFARKAPSIPPPHWLTKVAGRMSTICLCTSVNVGEEGAEVSSDDQWAQVLATLNCLLFFVFLIIYILGTIIFCT